MTRWIRFGWDQKIGPHPEKCGWGWLRAVIQTLRKWPFSGFEGIWKWTDRCSRWELMSSSCQMRKNRRIQSKIGFVPRSIREFFQKIFTKSNKSFSLNHREIQHLERQRSSFSLSPTFAFVKPVIEVDDNPVGRRSNVKGKNCARVEREILRRFDRLNEELNEWEIHHHQSSREKDPTTDRHPTFQRWSSQIDRRNILLNNEIHLEWSSRERILRIDWDWPVTEFGKIHLETKREQDDRQSTKIDRREDNRWLDVHRSNVNIRFGIEWRDFPSTETFDKIHCEDKHSSQWRVHSTLFSLFPPTNKSPRNATTRSKKIPRRILFRSSNSFRSNPERKNWFDQTDDQWSPKIHWEEDERFSIRSSKQWSSSEMKKKNKDLIDHSDWRGTSGYLLEMFVSTKN